MRFRWEFLLISALAGLIVWLAGGRRMPAWLGLERDTPVVVVPVKKSTAAVTVSVSGAIVPVREVQVASRLAGVLKELRVKVGDAVSMGEVVATVYSNVLAERQSEVEAMLMAARKNLAEKESGLAVAEEWAARRRELFQQDLIARREVEQSEAAAQTARAQRELARAQLAQQEAFLSQRRKIESLSQLTAPVSGVVSRSWIKPGARILESAPIVAIAEGGRMKFTGRVGGEPSIGLRRGFHAVISSAEGNGRTVEGYLSDVVETGENSKVANEIGISLQTTAANLRIGMAASALITLDRAREILLVPRAAVVEQGGTHYIFKLAGNYTERQEVVLGAEEGGDVEVRRGVAENDLVVVGDLRLLKPGVRVRPTTAEPLSKDSQSTS